MSSKAKKNITAFYLVSLGCPKNLVDSETIAGTLLTAGIDWEDEPEFADLYIINTCAFLPEARAEAEAEIRLAREWKQAIKGGKIAVAGCLPQYDRLTPIREKYPEVDYWIGINDLPNLAKIFTGEKTPDNSAEPTYLCSEKEPRTLLTLPHVAFLKIADGCNNRCSYCAIPAMRGNLRSRSIASVVQEAKILVEMGVKELVVIAQDVTAFGMDSGKKENLAGLLRELEKIEGDFVIRLLYNHPAHLTDDVIDLLGAGGKLLPYVDLPLQHISPRILKAMNRHITREETLELLRKLRERVPNLVLRTTFITGFPGETEEEFAELKQFAKEWKFERMGVFPYSPENGTKAAKMPGQIPLETANKRASELMKAQRARMNRYNAAMVGKKCKVLIDAINEEGAWGRGILDAPDIDNGVMIVGKTKRNVGDFAMVEITGSEKGVLLAKWADKTSKTSSEKKKSKGKK